MSWTKGEEATMPDVCESYSYVRGCGEHQNVMYVISYTDG
jgi:hypothetical protein